MECTAEERELLDALRAEPMADIEELRVKLNIARLPTELRERLIATQVELARASKANREAWDEVNRRGVCGLSVAFQCFYDAVTRGAE